LQGKSAQVILLIKQLKVLMKMKATAVETGEVMEMSDQGKDN
jgi:hypothetical protein